MKKTAIAIGKSYLEMTGGDVSAAVKAHSDSATDILIAHISIADPGLADRLADALEAS